MRRPRGCNDLCLVGVGLAEANILADGAAEQEYVLADIGELPA
jgi:hypothetical protein